MKAEVEELLPFSAIHLLLRWKAGATPDNLSRGSDTLRDQYNKHSLTLNVYDNQL